VLSTILLVLSYIDVFKNIIYILCFESGTFLETFSFYVSDDSGIISFYLLLFLFSSFFMSSIYAYFCFSYDHISYVLPFSSLNFIYIF